MALTLTGQQLEKIGAYIDVNIVSGMMYSYNCGIRMWLKGHLLISNET